MLNEQKVKLADLYGLMTGEFIWLMASAQQVPEGPLRWYHHQYYLAGRVHPMRQEHQPGQAQRVPLRAQGYPPPEQGVE